MDLKKNLTNEVTASLSLEGVLTLMETQSVPVPESLVMDGPEETETVTTEIVLPDYGVRALLNLLVTDEARKRIGHRRWQGSKPERKGK